VKSHFSVRAIDYFSKENSRVLIIPLEMVDYMIGKLHANGAFFFSEF